MNSSSGISGNGGPYDVTSLSLSKKPATIASTALCALLNSRLTSHNDGGAGTSRLVVLELDGRHVVEHVDLVVPAPRREVGPRLDARQHQDALEKGGFGFFLRETAVFFCYLYEHREPTCPHRTASA